MISKILVGRKTSEVVEKAYEFSFGEGQVLSVATQLRQCKYLNNIVKQDHRFIKRRVNPGLGFFSFKTARRTIGGYEVTNLIRKGQVEGIGKGDIRGQVRFVADLFKVAA